MAMINISMGATGYDGKSPDNAEGPKSSDTRSDRTAWDGPILQVRIEYVSKAQP